jgi:hypothetical protein
MVFVVLWETLLIDLIGSIRSTIIIETDKGGIL